MTATERYAEIEAKIVDMITVTRENNCYGHKIGSKQGVNSSRIALINNIANKHGARLSWNNIEGCWCLFLNDPINQH